MPSSEAVKRHNAVMPEADYCVPEEDRAGYTLSKDEFAQAYFDMLLTLGAGDHHAFKTKLHDLVVDQLGYLGAAKRLRIEPSRLKFALSAEGKLTSLYLCRLCAALCKRLPEA